MPRKKFEGENWHPEIGEWEKIIKDPWYKYKQVMKYLKQKEENKKALLNKDYCPHPKTGWFERQYMCFECGLVLERNYIQNNERGYGFRNHILRGGRKRKQ